MLLVAKVTTPHPLRGSAPLEGEPFAVTVIVVYIVHFVIIVIFVITVIFVIFVIFVTVIG